MKAIRDNVRFIILFLRPSDICKIIRKGKHDRPEYVEGDRVRTTLPRERALRQEAQR